MGSVVIRTGIIGLSEGNGHPFSFSAIVNGYDEAAFEAAGWPVILEYLRRQPVEAFGIGEARITHAWTQDAALTRRLCAACRIEHACADPGEMLGGVDAVIVARDDWESHLPLGMMFLERGLPVFIDKPLSMSAAELRAFEPYLRRGKLMSCSGLRFARELDALRDELARGALGDARLIVGTVVNTVEKYGIHLVEAVASLREGWSATRSLARLPGPAQSYRLQLIDGTAFLLNCLGPVARTFHLSVFGTLAHRHVDLHDNFTAFRRTLERFFRMVTDGQPPIDPDHCLQAVSLVSRALELKPGESVQLKDERIHAHG
jgi:hypothetical protein